MELETWEVTLLLFVVSGSNIHGHVGINIKDKETREGLKRLGLEEAVKMTADQSTKYQGPKSTAGKRVQQKLNVKIPYGNLHFGFQR